MKPEKFPSLQCDPCGLAVQVRNDLREHKKSELRNLSLQCDPCGEGADVSKDLKKHKEIKCDLSSAMSDRLLASLAIKLCENHGSQSSNRLGRAGLEKCLVRQTGDGKAVIGPG